jgi:hypothetical protein
LTGIYCSLKLDRGINRRLRSKPPKPMALNPSAISDISSGNFLWLRPWKTCRHCCHGTLTGIYCSLKLDRGINRRLRCRGKQESAWLERVFSLSQQYRSIRGCEMAC